MPQLKKQARIDYNNSMFKNFLIILGVAIALIISSSSWSPDTDPKEIVQKTSGTKKTIYIQNVKLAVDIADEPHEQTRGLSGKEYMAENEGMIFVFSESIIPAFWMKDMKLALDIIWVDAENTIIGIEKNVSTDTFPKIFSPPSPIKYALEVNANWSDKNQINPGDKLRLN